MGTPQPRAIYLRNLTQVKRSDADSGAITFIQRFGGAANLNAHLRALVLEGAMARRARP
jgi:hypothetical protein